METNAAQGSQRNPPGLNNITTHLVRKIHHYQRKCHAQRRKVTLTIVVTKTIEFTSQQPLAFMYPHPLREVQHGTAALSQKGKLEQNGKFAFKLSSRKVQSVWQRLQIPRVPICLRAHDRIRFQSHNNKLQYSKQQKTHLTCLWN